MLSVKRLFFFAVAIAALLSTGSIKTYAQKIGVVSGNDVLGSFEDAKKADEKIKAISQLYTDTLTMMNKAAQEKAEGYKKILSTMSEDAKQKAQAELDVLGRNIQEYQNSRFNQQDGMVLKARNEMVKPILEKIQTAVAAIAKKKKLDVILDKGNVVYVNADGVTDITDDVKKALK